MSSVNGMSQHGGMERDGCADVILSVRSADGLSQRTILMRNLLLAGTAGLLLAFGVGAADANNPSVPTWSPYSINTDLPGRTLFRHHARRIAEARLAGKLIEGRATDLEKWPTPPDNATSSGGDAIVGKPIAAPENMRGL
jgi:hypothetical protein